MKNDHGAFDQGLAALNAGSFDAAFRLAADLIADPQEAANGHFLAAQVLLRIGRLGAAIEEARLASADRASARHHALQAKLLLLAKREGEALALIEAARRQEIRDGWTADTLACALTALGRHGPARDLFDVAVKHEPDNAAYRCNYAACLVFHGEADRAEVQYQAALAIDRLCPQAYFGLANLRRSTQADNNLAGIDAAVRAVTQPADLVRLHYAAAKECEDIGDHAAAFAHLDKAGRLRRGTVPFDVEEACALLEMLPECAGSLPAPDDRAAGPIFIVGLPRTGTTLVDRILSSHPQVASAGELDAMPLAVKLLSGTRTARLLDPETARAAAGIDPLALRRAYLERAEAFLPEQKPRFTDKLPHNFLYLGQIARSMPDARIVCLRRGAMDSVWSNYAHLFAVGSREYEYSFDPMDCAAYYRAFDRLMARWQALLGPRLLQLGYEELVASPESRIRRLLDHCGLPWHAGCLDFQHNAAAVATPSTLQVREPLHGRSIGRWRRQAAALEPVRRYFAMHGIVTD